MTSDLDRRLVERHFSGLAGEYDRYAGGLGGVAAGLLGLWREPGGAARGRVLDVGTGTGALMRRLHAEYPGATPVMADLAHGMTMTAAAALPAAAAVDADARQLPFHGGAFSLVLSASVYQWVEPLGQAFAESFRVLSRGGRFAFALFGRRTLFELRQSHRRAAAEAGIRSHAQEFPDLEEIRRALREAGFVIERLMSEDEVEYHADVPELLRALKHIGAANAAADRPPGLASRRVMTRMMELYRDEFARDGRIPATYEVIYGFGRKDEG